MLGIVLGVIVTRSIVRPVKELKRTLLHMGKGIIPEREVRVTLRRNWRHGGCSQPPYCGHCQQFSQEVGGTF